MTARPVAGIVCCNRLVEGAPAQAVMTRYVAATMAHADTAALLIPALPSLMSASEIALRLDGLLLTGSPSNIEPWRYGQAVADAPGPFDGPRDQMTQDLIKAVAGLGRPVFAICRGFQEVNVALGGSLRRDVSQSPGMLAHHAPDGAGLDEMFDHRHEVALEPGGVLSRAFDAGRLHVNSVHYQGIDRLADGLKVEARADDGLVEAASADLGGAPLLAVQWHPEWDAADNPQSRAYFALFGRALRGEPLV